MKNDLTVNYNINNFTVTFTCIQFIQFIQFSFHTECFTGKLQAKIFLNEYQSSF